jgi:hypothetical protein
VVVANVTSDTGTPVISTFNAVATTDSFDIEINDIDTGSLTINGDGESRILPLPRPVGAVVNMQITSHTPTEDSAFYIPTGNDLTGYIVNYNGNAATLANTITSTGYTVEYTALTYRYASSTSANAGAKIYKTTNGIDWNFLTDLANVTINDNTTVQWNAAWDSLGTRLAVVSTHVAAGTPNNFQWYERSGDTFNIQTPPDPADLPGESAQSVAWAPNTDYVVVLAINEPRFTWYSRSSSNLTKRSEPDVVPTSANIANISWDTTSTYLAAGALLYKRNGNNLTKLYDILKDSTWHPDGNHLATWSGQTIRVYSRSGDTFTQISNPFDWLPPYEGGSSWGPIVSAAWNDTGEYFAFSWDDGSEEFYVQIFAWSGTNFTRLDMSDEPGINPLATGDNSIVSWGQGGQRLYIASPAQNARIYDVSYSTQVPPQVTLVLLPGLAAEGNVSAINNFVSYTTDALAYIEVDDAGIFSALGGDIRINDESLSYATANVAVSPNRLEEVVRGVSTGTFGVNAANLHVIGSQVFPIEQLDLTVKYFDTEAISTAIPYITSKSAAAPSIVLRDAQGDTTTGVVDVRLSVLPEQFMDDRNLGTR